MQFSLKAAFALLLLAAVLARASVWLQTFPASQTWSYGCWIGDNARINDSGRRPYFYLEIDGVGPRTPTVGFMVRAGSNDTSTFEVPREPDSQYRFLCGLRSDQHRSDFVLFVRTATDDLQKIRLDPAVARQWFGREPTDYNECVRFWEMHVAPRLSVARERRTNR